MEQIGYLLLVVISLGQVLNHQYFCMVVNDLVLVMIIHYGALACLALG